MKFYQQFTGAIALVVMFAACDPQPAASAENDSETNATQTVQLENGEKWEANPETSEAIYNMMLTVQQSRTLPKKTRCAQLKKSLENEFQNLVQKCTMTGEAHDQLHNYILPLRDLISKLEDNSHCQATVGEIERHLQTYSHYFR